jgi:hypothetical protein
MAVHHIPPPPKISTFIALYVTITFSVSTTPSFDLSARIFWKRNLKSLIRKRSTWKVTVGRNYYTDPKMPGTQMIRSLYLQSDHGRQLVNSACVYNRPSVLRASFALSTSCFPCHPTLLSYARVGHVLQQMLYCTGMTPCISADVWQRCFLITSDVNCAPAPG